MASENHIISQYLKGPREFSHNLNLARWYEINGHLSPACGFYLRAAELSDDSNSAYECMIRLYYCYSQLGNRDYTCENVLKMALNLKPKNPEAYFLLSQTYERKQNWMDSYLYASLGIDLSDRHPTPLVFGSGYSHEYMMVFQKAVAAWWYGRPKESRKLLRGMIDKYYGVMDVEYLALIQKSLSNIGSGDENESRCAYDQSMCERFRFKFPGIENIEINHSQVCQDLFVLAVLGGKRDGTYLEIGSAHPYKNSNTALLEELGWKGVGIEINKDLAALHSSRKNKVICTDALNADYESILSEAPFGEIVDYLQLDVEPPRNTFEAMLSIPFHKHKFRVITYEHDHYVDAQRLYKEKSRNYLRNLGYTLLVNDVSPNEDCSFEDWWVMDELVDTQMAERMRSYTSEINQIGKFMAII